MIIQVSVTATLSESIQFLTTSQWAEGLRSETVFWFSACIVTQDSNLKTDKSFDFEREKRGVGWGMGELDQRLDDKKRGVWGVGGGGGGTESAIAWQPSPQRDKKGFGGIWRLNWSPQKTSSASVKLTAKIMRFQRLFICKGDGMVKLYSAAWCKGFRTEL